MGRWRAVCLDLFGTLVPPFPLDTHSAVLDQCAGMLGLDPGVCDRAWRDAYQDRVRGTIGGIAKQLRLMATAVGIEPDPKALEDSATCYRRWASTALVPLPGALELVRALREHGLSLALVSNTSPDVGAAWRGCELAPHFTHCVFSFEVGAVKPEPAIYLAALERLGTDAADVLFVGDGSDDELSGAERCGLTAMRVKVDRSNTYDPEPAGLNTWPGLEVDGILAVATIATT